MKKANLVYLFYFLIIVAFVSCETSDYSSVEKRIIESEPIIGGGFPSCYITGSQNVCAGSSSLYSASIQDFVNPQFNWTISQGNMVFSTGTSSSNVGLNFLSNFNGGQLVLNVTDLSNPNRSCSEILVIGESTNCTSGWDIEISELIPACYPSSYPYGRYKIYDYPSGANITWSVRNAVIVNDYGDEIYVRATSQYNYTVSVSVSYNGVTKTDSQSFTPQNCSF